MPKFDDDDDILDSVVRSEDEEPTRSVEVRARASQRGPHEPEEPATVQAIPAVKRRGVWGASVHSLVGSEEALRGFDELSNPGESLATFTGANVEESRGETIPPREYSPMSSEGATQELSFIEPLDSVPLGPPPIPGGALGS